MHCSLINAREVRFFSEALTFLLCLFFAKYSTNIDSDFYFVCLSSIYSAVYFS